LFSDLFEILCKRNIVNGKFRGIQRGKGIALFYGRKSNDIDKCAVNCTAVCTQRLSDICVPCHGTKICSPILVAMDSK